MMCVRAVSLMLVAAVSLIVAVSPALADRAEVRPLVEQLFEVGWDSSLSARQLADDRYGEIQKFARTDADAAYAYALVQIKQRRYLDAGKLIDELLKTNADDVHLWKAKLWVSMITREYNQAVLEMDKLSETVAKNAERPEVKEQRREIAQLLGSMFGFLQGPAEGSVSDTVLDRFEGRILKNLAEDRVAFEAQRKAALDRFNELANEKADTEAESLAAAEEERERLIQDLEKQAVRIDERRKELAPVREKLVSEARAELDAIQEEDKPLATQAARIDAQGAVVRRELLLISDEITRLQIRADREKDPVIRDGLLRELSRISIIGRRYDSDYLLLERQARAIAAQRAQIQLRYQQTQATYNAQLKTIDGELAELSKQETRNAADRKRAEKPAKGVSSRSLAINAQAKALTSYYDFPLEAERVRVLEMFR